MASKGLSEDQIYQTLFPSESSGDEEEAPNPEYDDCDAEEGMEVGDGATGRLTSPSPSPSAASPPLLALPSPPAASPTPLSSPPDASLIPPRSRRRRLRVKRSTSYSSWGSDDSSNPDEPDEPQPGTSGTSHQQPGTSHQQPGTSPQQPGTSELQLRLPTTSTEVRSRKRRRGNLVGDVGAPLVVFASDKAKAKDKTVWRSTANPRLPRISSKILPKAPLR